MRLMVAVAVFAMTTSIVNAEFINGVERFDGTNKDTVTWEEWRFILGQEQVLVTQNNALIMEAINQFSLGEADITTRSVTVGIGGMVRAEMRANAAPRSGHPFLALTTNSRGTIGGTHLDSDVLLVRYSYGFGSFDCIQMRQGSAINGGGSFGNPQVLPVPGLFYTLQLERLTRDSVRCSAFQTETMVLLGSTSFTFAGVPDDLFIAMGLDQTSNGSFSFDNVTLPEPGLVTMMAVLPLVICSRWHGPRR